MGKRFFLHIPILVISIIAAVALAQSDALKNLLSFSGDNYLNVILASMLAGIFYSSIFTVAPATVALIEIAAGGASIPVMALAGGLGAMFADISIFEILKFSIIDDLIAYFQKRSRGHFIHLFKIRFFKLLIIAIGVIAIITPLPDEIGLTMMGIGKARLWVIALLTFTLNSLGIAAIALLVRAAL